MESRIPVPTDNIYKFYALFGLLLFVFAAGALVYSVSNANAQVVSAVPEIARLQAITARTPAEDAQLKLLERKMEIVASDRNFFRRAALVISGIGLVLMAYGFLKWHRDVQPVLDETARTQLEIAKLQLEKLKCELATAEKSAPATPQNQP